MKLLWQSVMKMQWRFVGLFILNILEYRVNDILVDFIFVTAQPVNFVTQVKFVTCRKNAQG